MKRTNEKNGEKRGEKEKEEVKEKMGNLHWRTAGKEKRSGNKRENKRAPRGLTYTLTV